MNKSIEEIKADYHLFLDIQMDRYLQSRNKSEFSNEEEAECVLKKIVETYNTKIAADHLRLDNLNKEAKIEWFNSVNIDLGTPDILSEPEKIIPDTDKTARKLISFYDNLFAFLPEGAVLYIINAGPAFEALGYPVERFKKLIEGEEPTEIEKDILEWAYDLGSNAALAAFEKDEFKKQKYLNRAILIAKEELEEESAPGVVAAIYKNFEKPFPDFKKQKHKSKKRKRK